MVLSDKVLTTFYRLSIILNVLICSGLAAVFKLSVASPVPKLLACYIILLWY